MLYLDLIVSFSRLLLYATFICIMFKVSEYRLTKLTDFECRSTHSQSSLFDPCIWQFALSEKRCQTLFSPAVQSISFISMRMLLRKNWQMIAHALFAEKKWWPVLGNVSIQKSPVRVNFFSSKKLPCGHIFHAACLRSWFQRQQTCPTCRLDVLRARDEIRTKPVRMEWQQFQGKA